eukprot:4851877-Prymnesium_polylepis.2
MQCVEVQPIEERFMFTDLHPRVPSVEAQRSRACENEVLRHVNAEAASRPKAYRLHANSPAWASDKSVCKALHLIYDAPVTRQLLQQCINVAARSGSCARLVKDCSEQRLDASGIAKGHIIVHDEHERGVRLMHNCVSACTEPGIVWER